MKFLIGFRDAGKKAQTLIQEHVDHSKSAIKKAIDQGALRINGMTERFASAVLQKGDRVTFDLNKIGKKASFSLPILYEDESLLFCNKPSGLVTHAQTFQKLLGFCVFLVHRLDKDTSGVLVLAKTKKMQGELERLFKKREVQKTYVALVKGAMRQEKGTIDNHLEKKALYQGQSIWGAGRRGLRAVTHWRCLKKGKGCSLVECQPETGRTHQIRVHFSEMGHPILGDHQYGRKVHFPKAIDRLCLHAYRLRFSHPQTGKKIQATAPIPTLFKI